MIRLPFYLATILCMLGAIGYFVNLFDGGTDVRREELVCISDCKSGCGCLRPRLQADGSWQVEFSNEDWRKE